MYKRQELESLTESVTQDEQELDRISRETVNAEKFLALVKKYTEMCIRDRGTAGTGVTASSYFSKDKDMLGAEKAYAKLEQKLQRYLDTYEALSLIHI